MEDRITIDKETLKAIASDSRLNILKALDKKKKILTDLSLELKLSNPTVKEHLDVLSKAGLVKKEESGRKWKYYSLTFKGKQLLKPSETRLFLALVISIIGTTIFGLFLLFNSSIGSSSNNFRMASDAAQPEMMKSFAVSSNDVLVTTVSQYPSVLSLFNLNNIVLTAFILAIIVIFILYIKKKRK